MLKNHYWIWDSAIPSEICDFVINTCNWDLAEDGLVYDCVSNSFIKDTNKRTSTVIWSPPLSVIGCIAQSYLNAANKAAGWNYKCSNMENIQLGRYTEGGQYDWHKDTFAPNENNEQRKLSISILLSDTSDFKGGEFMFRDLDDYQQPTMKQGSVLVFPSFLEHTVAPVISGERISAVTWINGSAFC